MLTDFEKLRRRDRRLEQQEFDFVAYHEIGHLLVALIHRNIPTLFVASPIHGNIRGFEEDPTWDVYIAGRVWEKAFMPKKKSDFYKARKEEQFYLTSKDCPTDWDFLGNPKKEIVDAVCDVITEKCEKIMPFSHEIFKYVRKHNGFLVNRDMFLFHQKFHEQYQNEVKDYMAWWHSDGESYLSKKVNYML